LSASRRSERGTEETNARPGKGTKRAANKRSLWFETPAQEESEREREEASPPRAVQCLYFGA